jgi:putative membrane protein
MSEADASQKAGQTQADPRVDLAVTRTELAWERTLLAWIRTTLALLGSGIALDKGAQLLHQARVLAGTAMMRNGHIVGLSLTGLSTLLLLIVTVQYLNGKLALARIKGVSPAAFHPAVISSVLVILLCSAVFVVLACDNS